MWPTSIVAALILAVLAGSWQLKRWAGMWGATPDDVRRAWPGDELSPHATDVTTRAVTIDAPAHAVWAWLVQIGQDRAGFYSFRWLENLFRCAMPRVERIVPEWQQRTLGDTVWLARGDRYGGEARQKVVRLDPGSVLSMASPADWGRVIRRESSLGGTWTFVLDPLDAHRTRLIVRSRGPEAPTLAGTLFRLGVFAPAHFIMERKMMLRIKSLAERHRQSAVQMTS